MDTVTVNEKTYTRAAKAARIVGYTADYIGQLCRKGAVEGIVLGKTWYVREESLLDHKHSQTRVNTATTKRDVAKQKRDALQTEAIARTSLPRHAAYRKHLLDTPIAYKPDTHELLPLIASQEPAPVEDAVPWPNVVSNSNSGDFEGMPANIGESGAFAHEEIEDIGEGEEINRNGFDENGEETSIQIRKVIGTQHQEASRARKVYRMHGHGSVGDAHFARGRSYLDEEKEEKGVTKPRRSMRAIYRPLLVCTLFFLFLLASLVLESTWTYIDKSSGRTQFQTNYTLASVHTVVEILKQVIF